MSCDKCNSDEPTTKRGPDHDGHYPQRLSQLAITFLPEGSALLSSSCCWLPTILDFLFAGSVAVNINLLRYLCLAISCLGIIWGLWREGLTRRMIWRSLICGALLAWAQVNHGGKVNGGKVTGTTQHSCH
ncbi:uncharacterized protein N7469_007981 [Penicillium citrinum]|uniref:Uncharacterized protein n=2 Tax=Penicillium TaxID=5073 RepID=A0A9W9TJ03_PENCI|nr:uncharacterized protein N7469_007981 [Penicillium citrinum]KAJ5224478.1 hypothetical protein N7469_007981 [Penicillium citrinum]KAJ5574730.1 hypothetical protein N7450_008629 [Penicillium hetheringtonii]